MENDGKIQVAACFIGHSLRRGYATGEKVAIPLSELIRSSREGCSLCGVLVEIVIGCVPGVSKESDGRVSVNDDQEEWWRIWGDIDLSWTPAIDPQNPFGPFRLDVFKLANNIIPFANVRVGRPPSGYTGSDMALSRAMEWIAECTSNHKFCGDDSPKLLPTRVLDLSTDEAGRHARIVMGGGEMSRYGTLSHCWGQRGNHRILTKATLKSWLKPFGITELPQTYQDAIMVTKRLGLRYLWVDSLCILQDVEEDWKRESSKMAEIYQNSYITVAATCAADSSAGIFLTARLIYNPKAIQYAGNGIEMQLYAHACLSHRTYDPVDRSHNSFYRWNLQDPVDFPLLSRAWVYQERLLSPRILHFLREELVFECCE